MNVNKSRLLHKCDTNVGESKFDKATVGLWARNHCNVADLGVALILHFRNAFNFFQLTCTPYEENLLIFLLALPCLFSCHTLEALIYLLRFRDLVFKGCLNSQVISDKLPVDICEKGFYI